MAFIVRGGLAAVAARRGGRWSRAPTVRGCVTRSGALGPARPPQPSWAHLRKVGMSRTGTLRVRALTRRFRSSVSKTTSLSKRMGSSANETHREHREAQTCPRPCTHPTACSPTLPAPCSQLPAPCQASWWASDTALHPEGRLLPSLCCPGMICDHCPLPTRGAGLATGWEEEVPA